MADKFEVLAKLQTRKNVLLIGAPGTGKSRLMNEVAEEFMTVRQPVDAPAHIPGAAIPIPADVETPIMRRLPFLRVPHKQVFRTTFHQNTKYRDLLTGIVPQIGTENNGYCVTQGILYRANEFAKQPDSAALVIFDEINRGPAVEAFGGSITALELDKRLAEDGTVLPTTQSFEIISPVDGNAVDYAFSPRLYILAAMNQADVSVAPLDVAFLRRWESVLLEPDYNALRTFFGITEDVALPEIPTRAEEVYFAAIRALKRINDKVAVGRGDVYRLGHGIFMNIRRPAADNLSSALDYCADVWGTIMTHIEELFFGNSISIGYVINASDVRSPYLVEEANFAEDVRAVLRKPAITAANVYPAMVAAGEPDV